VNRAFHALLALTCALGLLLPVAECIRCAPSAGCESTFDSCVETVCAPDEAATPIECCAEDGPTSDGPNVANKLDNTPAITACCDPDAPPFHPTAYKPDRRTIILFPPPSSPDRPIRGRYRMVDRGFYAINWTKPTPTKPVTLDLPVWPDPGSPIHRDELPTISLTIAARSKPPPLSSRTRRAVLCVRTI
jgi:hypothetical protein